MLYILISWATWRFVGEVLKLPNFTVQRNIDGKLRSEQSPFLQVRIYSLWDQWPNTISCCASEQIFGGFEQIPSGLADPQWFLADSQYFLAGPQYF